MNTTDLPPIKHVLNQCGLIAILRGVQPEECVEIGTALYETGFRMIEVPLNSPDPMRSIAALRKAMSADCLIGAGTVLRVQDCQEIQDVGAQLVVMPHCDVQVIMAAKRLGLICAAGVATPTEAFQALNADADMLKMFPAECLGVPAVKAWRSVLPRGVPLVPVGGILPESLAGYASSGVSGFGLGSGLYRPGDSADQVALKARLYMTAWKTAFGGDRTVQEGRSL